METKDLEGRTCSGDKLEGRDSRKKVEGYSLWDLAEYKTCGVIKYPHLCDIFDSYERTKRGQHSAIETSLTQRRVPVFPKTVWCGAYVSASHTHTRRLDAACWRRANVGGRCGRKRRWRTTRCAVSLWKATWLNSQQRSTHTSLPSSYARLRKTHRRHSNVSYCSLH